jgi:hypothetical protein
MQEEPAERQLDGPQADDDGEPSHGGVERGGKAEGGQPERDAERRAAQDADENANPLAPPVNTQASS